MKAKVTIRRGVVAKTLLWEFWRRGWLHFLIAQVANLGVSSIVYASLVRSGPLDVETGRTLHVVLLWIGFAASGGAALAAHGEPVRFFHLPVSNAGLAATMLFPGMVVVAAMYSITAGLLNALFGVAWPVAGPALFLAAALGAVQASATAAGTNRQARLAAWCLVGFLFERWLCALYGGGDLLSLKATWVTVTGRELFLIGTVVGIEFLVMMRSIARERRGDVALVLRIPWRPKRRRAKGDHLSRFRSSATAQFWFEWKQKGLILPAIFAVFAAFMIVGYVLNQFDNGEYELLHACLGFGIGLAPIALVAGLVLGHVDLPRRNADCDSFLAVRPATTAALSGALLKTEFASVLITWGFWCAAMAGSTTLLYADQGSEPVLDLWTHHGEAAPYLNVMGGWYAALVAGTCLVTTWTPLALATSLVLTGRQRLLIAVVASGLAVMLLCLMFSVWRAEGRLVVADAIWQCVVGIAAGIMTVSAFVMAARRGLIGWPTCGAALAGWMTLCGLAGSARLLVGSLEPAPLVLTAGLLALPVAPLAAAPLALAWNRHR